MKIYCMILRNAVYIMEYGNTLVKENKSTRTLFCEVRVQGDYFRSRRDTKLLLSCVTYLCVPCPHSPLIACSLVGFVWLVFGGPLKRKRELFSLMEKEQPRERADCKWTDDLLIKGGVN